MERLIQLLLFSGFWTFTQSDSNKYVLIQENKTWAEALDYCRKYHIDLATIRSNEDKTSLQEAVSAAVPQLAWIGLSRSNNSWNWNYLKEKLTFMFWKSGQPDNAYAREECAVITASGWEDMSCGGMFPFFCYNVSRADRFVFISQNKSWGAALSYCTKYHTDLASIRNQTENDLLVNMMVGFEKAWVGMFKDWWRWSDKTNIYTVPIIWSAGQPDVTGLYPLCGAAALDGVDDRLCPETLPFICLRHTKKQILKVEMKSSQNLNDPAVMEKILQLIKQKLKDRGIGNDTTLTWKVQPDGNIFSPQHESEEDQKQCPNRFF